MKMTVIAVAALGLTGSFGLPLPVMRLPASSSSPSALAVTARPVRVTALKYPKLAGRDAAFVNQQLRAFKSGAR